MYFRSIDDMNHSVLRGLPKIPEEVDVVVGIPRSGMLAATMLALYLNRPIADLEGLLQGRVLGKGKRVIKKYNEDPIRNARKILVFDDCVSRGGEIRRVKQIIDDAGLSDRVIYGVVYSFPENPDLVDIVMEMVPRPMCFQWSCMYTPELEHCCVDIDGILCHDCPKDDDDDGSRYLGFLENAPPLFLPTYEVGALVTSRLEKYRPQTEAWLARHGVNYRKLVMMDVPSAAHRADKRAVWDFKSNVFKHSKALLFIESCPEAAREIHLRSGKPALCLENATMYGADGREETELLLQRTGIRRKLQRIKTLPNRATRKLLRRLDDRSQQPTRPGA